MSSHTRQASEYLDQALESSTSTSDRFIIAALRNIVGHLEETEQRNKPPEVEAPPKRRNMFASCATIEEIIGQAVGAGSTCWEDGESAEFDSARASMVVDDALQRIWQLRNNKPYQMSDAEYNEMRGRFG